MVGTGTLALGLVLLKSMFVAATTPRSGAPAIRLEGPIEQALIGTPVADANQPIEVLRNVHSFDPCLACTVH